MYITIFLVFYEYMQFLCKITAKRYFEPNPDINRKYFITH